MSADLWSEFGGGDPRENPWASPTRTNTEPSLSASTKVEVPLNNELKPEIDSTILWEAPANIWGEYSLPESTDKPWSFETDDEAAWADIQSSNSKPLPWEKVDDDFGEFEGPDGNTSNDVPRASEVLHLHGAAPPALQRLGPSTSKDEGGISIRQTVQRSSASYEHESGHLQPYTADEWDDFTQDRLESPILVAKTPAAMPASNTPDVASSSVNSDLIRPDSGLTSRVKQVEIESKDRATNYLPPRNVPPPSILLGFACTAVLKNQIPVKPLRQTAQMTDSTEKELEDALRDYLETLRVFARILAGRKVRWKRDSNLSQSMKIGPAGGKAGGMKLVAVDKAEAKREDRDAAEFIRIWKENLNQTRGSLAMAKMKADLPGISETMAIRTLKRIDGGITAPGPCALCGLRREERVSRVDVDILDSFSEWWVDFFGHAACKQFWEDNEEMLRQR